MVEPIGHTGGIIDPPDEYLPQLREICDRHNVLLIFDEIITGIGRTGNMFAAETFGVTPDLICLGKGISGGYAPLSALICRRHIADAFWGDATKKPGFVEGHTFEGNPISCAARLATIDEILQRALPANVRAMGEKLRAGLENMKHRNVIGDIRGKGLFLGIEFVRNTATKERFDPPIGIDSGKRALANGLLTRFDPHWIALGPPLTIDEQCVNAIVTLLGHSIGEVLDDRNQLVELGPSTTQELLPRNSPKANVRATSKARWRAYATAWVKGGWTSWAMFRLRKRGNSEAGPYGGPHTSPVQEAWTALPPLVYVNYLRPFAFCRNARCQHQLGNGVDRPGIGLQGTIGVPFGDE